MELLDLPDELLDLCCAQITQLPDVANEWGEVETPSAEISNAAFRSLRLTCKRLSPIATKRLFSHVHLLPTRASALKTRSIVESPGLVPLVNTVSIQPSLDFDGLYGRRRISDPPHPSWDCHDEGDPEWEADGTVEEHAIDTDGEISSTFKRILSDIGMFPNLKRVELLFDHLVCGPEDYGYDARETKEYRDTFLSKVLGALNHPVHPAGKLHSLYIHNLQDWANADMAASEDFQAVLSKLDSLELCIVSERYDAAPEFEIDVQERHDFYSKDLRDHWFQPLCDYGRLTTLKLYGTIFWGYLPKCDFRGLHFPKLKSLALGHMTFTHDWQLDWITSHGGTLESLALDKCPIIPDIELQADVDSEYYSLRNHGIGTHRGRRIGATWSYAARWHHYFRKFRTCLPHLRRFAMGQGLTEYQSCAMATFAGAESLPARLLASRYRKMTG